MLKHLHARTATECPATAHRQTQTIQPHLVLLRRIAAAVQVAAAVADLAVAAVMEVEAEAEVVSEEAEEAVVVAVADKEHAI